tara:strand:- start:430 stop:624 length:195 start_codon:yes stop_codon:yes gene_type:complete
LTKKNNSPLRYGALSSVIVVGIISAFFIGKYLDDLYFNDKHVLSIIFSLLVVFGLLLKLVKDFK